jgi:hypothetical protein
MTPLDALFDTRSAQWKPPSDRPTTTPHRPTRRDPCGRPPVTHPVHSGSTVGPPHSTDDSRPVALYSARQMEPPFAIPKTLEAKVAHVARRLRKAPRLVLKEAIDEYVARQDSGAVTEAMNGSPSSWTRAPIRVSPARREGPSSAPSGDRPGRDLVGLTCRLVKSCTRDY